MFYSEQVLYKPTIKRILIQTNVSKLVFSNHFSTLKRIYLFSSMKVSLELVLSWQYIPYLFLSRNLTSQMCRSIFRDTLNILKHILQVLSLNQFNTIPHSHSYLHLCCKNCNIQHIHSFDLETTVLLSNYVSPSAEIDGYVVSETAMLWDISRHLNSDINRI